MSEILRIDTSAGVTTTDTIEDLPLYNDNHPMLKVAIPEHRIQLPNPLMSKLVKRLKQTKQKYGGIGLSANQCGVMERVFVIGYEETNMVCINPKIIDASADLIKDNEGCLSFPGLYVKISRPSWLEVEYVTENGELIRQRIEGLTARCFAHELDHMNGTKFTEHVGPVALRLAKDKQEKRIKKHVRNRKK